MTYPDSGKTSSRLFAMRTLLAAGLLISLMIGAIPAAESASFLERAQQQFDEGDLDAARIELKNALQREPNNAAARFLLGKVYLELGDSNSAEKEFLRARDLGYESEELDLMLSDVRLKQRRYEAVITDISEEIALESALHRDLYVARGEALLGLGRIDEAETIFDRVLRGGLHIRALTNKARIAMILGDMDKARDQLDRAIATDPDDPLLVARDAEWFFFARRFEEAKARFTQAIELDPTRLDTRLGQIQSYLALGDIAEATQIIQSLKASQPDNLIIVLQDSIVQLLSGNFRQAKTAADRVLAVVKKQPQALLVSGHSAYQLQQFEQARARLSTYLSLQPGDEQARMALGATMLRLNYPEDAYSTMSAPGGEIPDSADYLRILTRAAFGSGEIEAGFKYLEQLATKNPDNAEIQEHLGAAKISSGQLNDGVAALEQSILLDPTRLSAHARLFAAYLHQRSLHQATAIAEQVKARFPGKSLGDTFLGLVFIHSGDRKKAKEAFLTAINKEPKNFEAASNLANIFLIEEKYDEAREIYQRMLSEDPNRLNSLLNYAELEKRAGNQEKEIELLTSAAEVSPTALQPRLRLAYILIGREEYQAVLEVAEPVMEQYAANPNLLTVVGTAQLFSGQSGKATETFRKLTTIESSSPEAYFLLARAYALGGETKKVADVFEKALEINSHHYPTRVAYARFAVLQQEWTKARELLDGLMKQMPDNPEVLEIAGVYAISRGDTTQAIEHLIKAQQGFAMGDVKRRIVSVNLARAYLLAGDTKRALAVLEAWLQDAPNDTPARQQLAGGYMVLERYDEAQENYKYIIEIDPLNWIAHNELAMILISKGEPKAAMTHAETAYNLASDNPFVLDTLGIALLANGESQRALTVLEKASHALPDNREIDFHLSQALDNLGRTEEAKVILDRILAQEGAFNDRDEAERLHEKLQPN